MTETVSLRPELAAANTLRGLRETYGVNEPTVQRRRAEAFAAVLVES